MADPDCILSNKIWRINALLQVQLPMTVASHPRMRFYSMHSMAYGLPAQLLNPAFPFT